GLRAGKAGRSGSRAVAEVGNTERITIGGAEHSAGARPPESDRGHSAPSVPVEKRRRRDKIHARSGARMVFTTGRMPRLPCRADGPPLLHSRHLIRIDSTVECPAYDEFS